MPDERQDSIRQGIGVPPATEIGAAAEAERQERAAQGPEIGGAMGGTSDVDRAGDEAQFNAGQGTGLPQGAGAGDRSGDQDRTAGEDEDPGAMYRDIPGDRIGG